MEEEEPYDWEKDLPNYKEFANAHSKMTQFLAAGHGQGYHFVEGPFHDPENLSAQHYMYTPSGKWAGEISHREDGTVGHLYVYKDHRAALPALFVHATNYAERMGWLPPHRGGVMSPKAYKMASKILPDNTRQTGGSGTGPVNNSYGD